MNQSQELDKSVSKKLTKDGAINKATFLVVLDIILMVILAINVYGIFSYEDTESVLLDAGAFTLNTIALAFLMVNTIIAICTAVRLTQNECEGEK